MSTEATQPTKFRVHYFTISGVDLRLHLRRFQLFQTIKKPYFTAKAVLADNNNIIENMKLVGGEPMTIRFSVTSDKAYSGELRLLKIHGSESKENLRTMVYDIDFIGDLFFADKQSLVQQSFKGISGTDAIALISNSYLGGKSMKILDGSLGPISLQSYIVSGDKPLKAISDIAKRLTYGRYKTGNTLYFQNNDGLNLGPLEALFDQLVAENEFIQKNTWGRNWDDIFTSINAIIACTAELDSDQSASRGSVQDVAGAAVQEKRVFDYRLKDTVVKKAASQVNIGDVMKGILSLANLGSVASALNRHGSMPNYMTMDSSHLPKETDPSVKSEEERLYAALTKNGPTLLVKVPIQTGVDLTVGKGANLKLIPPMGDAATMVNSDMSGLYLVTELCHDLILYPVMNGTTTFQGAKSGQAPSGGGLG